jgi:DNA polymerase-3 subunit epsilon/CBS domain-containing protein
MMASNAVPLVALDAVVFDTETTGLDPGKARIVDIAAVRIVAGRLEVAAPFRSLVRPDEPIPAAASQIHGVDDNAVSAAPPFAEIWPAFSDFTADSVLVGHTLGFDLAVLRRECARAGLSWRRPRTLDTRLLAEVAEPNLPGFALEQLAAWLEVAVENRHNALGDAVTTARLFLALIPRLRDRGVRTLAEAEQACRKLTAVLDGQHRAGWVEAVQAQDRPNTERALSRVDSYPYRHRVRDLMTTPVQFVAPQASLADAIGRMTRERCSSLFVSDRDDPPRPSETGIITERDVTRALASHGAGALAMPVERFMSRPLSVVGAAAFVYRAIGRMERLKLRHLGVVDDDGAIVGALSARDLLRLRADAAISLRDDIEQAADVPSLARAWALLPHAIAGLRAEAVSGRDIAAVISSELSALTQRAAIIAEQRMLDAGRGAAPCGYALAVLGSAGRGESLLAMDQDNAIVFAQGAPDGAEDRWFETLAIHVADILHEVGVPYCAGGVMAKNPPWRGSLATWRTRIAGWIRRSDPQDLLSVDIFFDLLPVHGDTGLAEGIWRHAFDLARGEAAFAKLLADAAGAAKPALGLFGRLKTERGRIDLKKSGLHPIVNAARVLAIRHHLLQRATPARLAAIRAAARGGGRDLEALDEAHATFVDLVIDQQLEDIDHGRPPSNAVVVQRLSQRQRERLRAALAAVEPLDELRRELLFRE